MPMATAARHLGQHGRCGRLHGQLPGHSGWQRGRALGLEVQLPTGFDVGRADATLRQTAAQWTAEGVQAMGGGPLPAMDDAAILLPAGARGPAFLVGANFRAILRYNNSTSYALAVGLLAQRLRWRPRRAGALATRAGGAHAQPVDRSCRRVEPARFCERQARRHDGAGHAVTGCAVPAQPRPARRRLSHPRAAAALAGAVTTARRTLTEVNSRRARRPHAECMTSDATPYDALTRDISGRSPFCARTNPRS
jgi:hypothetical protein